MTIFHLIQPTAVMNWTETTIILVVDILDDRQEAISFGLNSHSILWSVQHGVTYIIDSHPEFFFEFLKKAERSIPQRL